MSIWKHEARSFVAGQIGDYKPPTKVRVLRASCRDPQTFRSRSPTYHQRDEDVLSDDRFDAAWYFGEESREARQLPGVPLMRIRLLIINVLAVF